jgi:quinol monooxygenase YgiN
MLTIMVRFEVLPEWADRWLDLTREFTDSTRAEESNAWFLWSRDVQDPCVFYLLEGHREEGVQAHLASPLIPKIKKEWPQALVRTPTAYMSTGQGDSWTPMDEQLPVPPR